MQYLSLIHISVRNLKELAKTAEECDVVLGMEVLNRYEGYILNTCEEAVSYTHLILHF